MVSSVVAAQPVVDDEDNALQEALQGFQVVLTDDQRAQFQHVKTVPDAAAIIVFTAELDAIHAQRRRSGFATRLYSLLQSIQQFTSVLDTYAQIKPEIAALVWGSVKLAILVGFLSRLMYDALNCGQIMSNFTSYFDKISTLFMSVSKLCPQFSEYQILYPSSKKLQIALANFHACIIRCCTKAVKVIQRPGKLAFSWICDQSAH